MWDSFKNSFCKVEFLCYAGDPNWLGWLVIGIGSFLFLYLIKSGIIGYLLFPIADKCLTVLEDIMEPKKPKNRETKDKKNDP